MADEFEINVRSFAAQLARQAEDDQSVRIGICHAATMLFASLAIEHQDPKATLDALFAEMRAEADALVEAVFQHEAQGGLL